MTPEESRHNALPSASRYDDAVDRLSRLRAELVSEALRRAVDDASAAMVHRFGDPLTALWLYLHEIKQLYEQSDDTQSAPAMAGEIVDMALRETERVCDIVERVRKAGEMPVGAKAAVARGREAIDAWASNSSVRVDDAPSAVHPRARSRRLTPREHEVLALITGGCSNKEGVHRLGISTRTFEAHRAHIMWKFGARNAADLIRKTLNGNLDAGVRPT